MEGVIIWDIKGRGSACVVEEREWEGHYSLSSPPAVCVCVCVCTTVYGSASCVNELLDERKTGCGLGV